MAWFLSVSISYNKILSCELKQRSLSTHVYINLVFSSLMLKAMLPLPIKSKLISIKLKNPHGKNKMFIWFNENNSLKSHFWTSKSTTWIERPKKSTKLISMRLKNSRGKNKMFIWFNQNDSLKSHFWTSKNTTWIERPKFSHPRER